MSQQEASNDYTQASSFAQNDLDETTLTTDLETKRNTKPFKPVVSEPSLPGLSTKLYE